MFGFIGGTGPEGRGLALRFALAGEEVVIGSRSAERGREAAQKVLERAPGYPVSGAANAEAAEQSDVVFITVPYGGQRDTLTDLTDALKGKLIVNVVAPLEFVDGSAVAVMVEEGSAAQQCQLALPDSYVVAAFQNLSARDLLRISQPVDGDVVVCSDHVEAKARVMAMAERIPGVRGVDGGKLANARYVEDMTTLLLNINQIYKAHSMFRITGVEGLADVGPRPAQSP